MKIKTFFKTHGWTQRTMARNKFNHRVHPKSPESVCFCLVGAIVVCYPRSGDQDKVWDKLIRRFKGDIFGASKWNDEKGRTKTEVIALAKELDI